MAILQTNNDEVLTENAVTQQYFADTHKAHHLLPPVSNLKRYQVLEWLYFITRNLRNGVGALFNPESNWNIKR